jgi:membrane-associated phospholipid phosphatase
MNLESWNRQLFEIINSGFANPVFDFIMPFIREPNIWTPAYIFFAVFFIVNFRMQGLYIILFGLFTFIISDQLSAHVLKQVFMHPRPCSDVSMANHVRLLIPCGAGYSFPSTHATNHFAFSYFLISLLGLRIKWLAVLVILWATLVCFAQVYVGVHYPIDVICGALLGILIGYWTGYICKMAIKWDLAEAE